MGHLTCHDLSRSMIFQPIHGFFRIRVVTWFSPLVQWKSDAGTGEPLVSRRRKFIWKFQMLVYPMIPRMNFHSIGSPMGNSNLVACWIWFGLSPVPPKSPKGGPVLRTSCFSMVFIRGCTSAREILGDWEKSISCQVFLKTQIANSQAKLNDLTPQTRATLWVEWYLTLLVIPADVLRLACLIRPFLDTSAILSMKHNLEVSSAQNSLHR